MVVVSPCVFRWPLILSCPTYSPSTWVSSLYVPVSRGLSYFFHPLSCIPQNVALSPPLHINLASAAAVYSHPVGLPQLFLIPNSKCSVAFSRNLRLCHNSFGYDPNPEQDRYAFTSYHPRLLFSASQFSCFFSRFTSRLSYPCYG
jgi:hypothetical protein